MKLELKEITKEQFDEISNREGNYFQNSCVFNYDSDNLLAFMDLYDNKFSYWKVVKK
jgi:hypothetical protein